jgi:radical SAM protein with 4Fe4S-binding SPASM domain
MYYKLSGEIALRKWKYVDRAVYKRGVEHALPISQKEFDTLLLCDGKHDLENNDTIEGLKKRNFIEECSKGDGPSEWSSLKEYDNYYFPSMNLMITGKCNLNCIHCFNAKDNDRLNTELTYEEVLDILDQAKGIGVHSFTITGGEPLVHKHFMDIIHAIYDRDMYVFELNTNGILITQEMLDEFKEIGCRPLIKISFDGIGYHNWMRQNDKAEEKTIEAIKLCIKNGFSVKAQVQVHLKNVEVMMDTAKLLNELGVSEMRIIRTTEAPRWEQNSPNTSIPLEDYFEKMLDFADEYMKSGMKMDIDIWQFLSLTPHHGSYRISPIMCNMDDFNVRIPICKGNRGMIAITSSGEVVPCMQMSGWFMEHGISLANVKKQPLKDIVTKSDYLDIAMATVLQQILANEKCADCKYYMACTGGCPALGRLYSHRDDFYGEDITKCTFFENGWYDRVTDTLKDYHLENPLNI